MRTVLLVTNIPTPYRIPLFNELDLQLKEKGMRLKVIFGASGYSRRKWQIDLNDCHFDFQILYSRKIRLSSQEKVTFTYPRLFRRIRRENPMVVITNAFSFASTMLWLRSFFHEKPPYIIWSGAIARPGEPKNRCRKIQRRALVKRATGFISYGTLSKHYLISLGASEEKITIAFNTADTDFFTRETARIRETLQSDGKKHLLYIGHFTKGKRLDLVFRAIKKLVNERQDFVLELVGMGPEENALKKMSGNLGIQKFVCFHGFKQKKDIPFFLAQADCFLFPSEYDVWGLVLVEAMAGGIPCIVSQKAGAAYDLVIDGQTGFITDFSDVEKTLKYLKIVLDDKTAAQNIAKNASLLISTKMSIAQSARAIIKCVVSSMS